MTWTTAARQRADGALLVAARKSQAVVIETVDRVVDVGGNKAPWLVALLVRVPADFGRLLLEDPAKAVDDGYDLLQRLTGLHREFAQRLFEIVDPQARPTVEATDRGDSVVLPFRLAHRAR